MGASEADDRPAYAGPVPSHPLDALTRMNGVADAVAEARTACEELRWHRALRRQWLVARTEAGVRCAHAGAVVDGVRLPLDLVRDLARGAAGAPSGPEVVAALAALRVQAEVERLMAAPGAVRATRPVPFNQLLARLHVAATAVGATGSGGPAGPTSDHTAGRPRADGAPQDLHGLGAAPSGAELGARLTLLADLVAEPLPPQVPALVLAAVVHGEVLALRPFDRGNGPVARAVFRHLLTSGGVDPVGVVVPEAQWAGEPNVYLAAAAGFATGTAEGVAHWLRYCARSVVSGAVAGRTVADAVLAGRLSADPPGGQDAARAHDDGAP